MVAKLLGLLKSFVQSLIRDDVFAYIISKLKIDIILLTLFHHYHLATCNRK